MNTRQLQVETDRRLVTDITDQVQEFAADAGGDGLLNAFLPHATAGLALLEIGSGSEQDLGEAVQRILPREDMYAHKHGSIGHGGDHVLPVFVSPSLVLPIQGGRLELGPWQSLVIVDPNRENSVRTVRLSFLPG